MIVLGNRMIPTPVAQSPGFIQKCLGDFKAEELPFDESANAEEKEALEFDLIYFTREAKEANAKVVQLEATAAEARSELKNLAILKQAWELARTGGTEAIAALRVQLVAAKAAAAKAGEETSELRAQVAAAAARAEAATQKLRLGFAAETAVVQAATTAVQAELSSQLASVRAELAASEAKALRAQPPALAVLPASRSSRRRPRGNAAAAGAVGLAARRTAPPSRAAAAAPEEEDEGAASLILRAAAVVGARRWSQRKAK